VPMYVKEMGSIRGWVAREWDKLTGQVSLGMALKSGNIHTCRDAGSC